MTKIINLTPHPCIIYREEDDTLVMSVPASGKLARCTEEVHRGYPIEIDGAEIETGSKTFGKIEGLPEQDSESIYFVSAVVATAAWSQGRMDVVCPLKAKRDEQGRIVGTYGLAVHPLLRPKE